MNRLADFTKKGDSIKEIFKDKIYSKTINNAKIDGKA